MAWGNKTNTRVASQRSSPESYARPEIRSAAAVGQQLSNGWNTWPVGQDGERLNVRVAEHLSCPDIEPVDIPKLELDMTRNRLTEIKVIVGELTYGEMMLLVEQITKCIPERHADKGQNSDDWMPSTLHAWTKT